MCSDLPSSARIFSLCSAEFSSLSTRSLEVIFSRFSGVRLYPDRETDAELKLNDDRNFQTCWKSLEFVSQNLAVSSMLPEDGLTSITGQYTYQREKFFLDLIMNIAITLSEIVTFAMEAQLINSKLNLSRCFFGQMPYIVPIHGDKSICSTVVITDRAFFSPNTALSECIASIQSNKWNHIHWWCTDNSC